MNDPARPSLTIHNAGVDYRLFHHRSRSMWSRLWYRPTESEPLFRGNGYIFETLVDISLSLAPGDRLAVIGASGSGKTTIALIAAGILKPTRGNVVGTGVVYSVIGGGGGPHPDAALADLGIYEALRRGRPAEDGLRWIKEAISFSEVPASGDTFLSSMSHEDVRKIRVSLGLVAGAAIYIFDDVVVHLPRFFREKVVSAFSSDEMRDAIILVCERTPEPVVGLCHDAALLERGVLSLRTPIDRTNLPRPLLYNPQEKSPGRHPPRAPS